MAKTFYLSLYRAKSGTLHNTKKVTLRMMDTHENADNCENENAKMTQSTLHRRRKCGEGAGGHWPPNNFIGGGACPAPNNPMALVYFYVILLLIISRSVFVFI